MRIITGKSRGTTLVTLEGENTRPTSERAKEAVFSMLQFELEGRRVLDLFGGSGQLALEALSRGAASAVIADSSRQAVEIIKKNAEKTRLAPCCNIICADWTQTLRRLATRRAKTRPPKRKRRRREQKNCLLTSFPPTGLSVSI